MNSFSTKLTQIQEQLLSEKISEKAEQVIVYIAIVSFLIHLSIIAVVDLDFLNLGAYEELTINPISALYTPFSIILIYEVYLLVFYLPKSITNYIGKQYEIITLILIRKIFYDLSNLEFSENWFSIQGDLQFTVDIVATLLLFTLIFFFYKIDQKNRTESSAISIKTKKYIKIKRLFASLLVPIIIVLALFSLGSWIYETGLNPEDVGSSLKSLNSIFFDDFFTVLILTDVLLLLFSFLQTNQFSRVIRNSGFIISTVLIKLSFSADGILNTILIVVAVSFGVLILLIYNMFNHLKQSR
ncbi:hypothetical protein [Psychroflexus planctonicus]|uniref:Uncharacterized protein n=1 Tax=Psychroflexus planctonicus TaxID=1526575 RepID=A0ABQ1SGY4_9FLAO|nr:hypothetical protein [Psychroflexus planctonicus]GGE39560.1 hypothetical protein GCM10010832_19730 [Psychroflexus planctonicus]